MRLIASFKLLALICALVNFTSAQAYPVAIGQQKKVSGESSLVFIENKGQVTDQYRRQRSDIDFRLSVQNMNIFIGDGQIHYIWEKSEPETNKRQGRGAHGLRRKEAKEEQRKTELYRLDVVLVGSNRNAELTLEDAQAYHENYQLDYFTGTVQSYKKATYKNVYPNIDWVLYINNGQLKYDFIVHAGGDPDKIKLRYDGANALKMKEGSVAVITPFGSITEQAPYTYDAVTKQMLKSSFFLKGNVLSFKVANENSQDIVIDPGLMWASYVGGTSSDEVLGLQAIGTNVYICGFSNSSANIATTGAYQTTKATYNDGFVAVFNAAGQRLWSTYLGGNNLDVLHGIDVDGAGNIYVSGETMSTSGIATIGAHQTSNAGNWDNMLVKLSSAGSLIWGTYYGGGSVEGICKVKCDNTGNVYIAGETTSTTGISSGSSVHRTTHAGAYDVYLAKFDSSGTRQWTTYYGGADEEWIADIDCDTTGAIYIVGDSWSDTGIASPGSHLSIYTAGGMYVGFLAKFSPAGQRNWSTFYGPDSTGVGGTNLFGIDIDASNRIYICGHSNEARGIATAGTFKSANNNNMNYSFLARFDVAGNRKWGTYFGAVLNCGPSLAVQQECMLDVVAIGNKVYGVGYSDCGGLATAGAWQSALSLTGETDYYLAEFDTSGGSSWATYYGGWGDDYSDANRPLHGGFPLGGGGMASNAVGQVFFVVQRTNSTTQIATSGAFQSALGGDRDGAIGCFHPDTMICTVVDSILCPGQSFILAYTSVHFGSSNTFTAQLSNSSGSFASPTTLGTATASTGTITCTVPSALAAGSYRIRLVASHPARNSEEMVVRVLSPVSAGVDTIFCEGDTIHLHASSSSAGTFSYAWAGPGSFTAATQSIKRASATTMMSGNYIVSATYGCTTKDTVYVTVKARPDTPDASYNPPLCIGDTLRLSSIVVTGASYSWTGPNSFSASARTPEKVIAQLSDSGYYIVKAIKNGCVSYPATIKVGLNQVGLDVSVSPGDTICETAPVTFIALAQTASVTPSYQWYSGITAFSGATADTFASNGLVPADSIIYCSISVNGVCAHAVTKNDTVRMHVKPLPSVTATPVGVICTGDTLYLDATTATGATYSWTGANSFISYAEDTFKANVQLADDGLYIVSTTRDGCSSADTIVVDVESCTTDSSSNIVFMPNKFPAAVRNTEGVGELRLFPNPNKGSFIVAGTGVEEVDIVIVNAIGQIMYKGRLKPASDKIRIDATLQPGNYLLKLREGRRAEVLRFVVSD